eukprot:4877472-Ditylum_brightwellii.AAC.1
MLLAPSQAVISGNNVAMYVTHHTDAAILRIYLLTVPKSNAARLLCSVMFKYAYAHANNHDYMME